VCGRRAATVSATLLCVYVDGTEFTAATLHDQDVEVDVVPVVDDASGASVGEVEAACPK
jgi:hypothetical protein